MKKFDDWFDENGRKVWLFIGAVLIALVARKPLLASAVYFLGIAIIPKED
ncbi:MAG: hypothetical protein J6S60_00175 [Oscillospiraceae bacterium]|nr:hypothetical protein [Oscillospiraceae bacterium]